MKPNHPERRPFQDDRLRLIVLLALSVIGLCVRLYATRTVGFGDSEALYASYAFFRQPAYVDHPGLVGLVARALGDGLAPSPLTAHTFTTILVTFAPWVIVIAGKLLGATFRASLGAAIAVAVAPEIAVGLFGMTPDLFLFYAWVTTLALFGRALLSRPGSMRAAFLFVASGIALGTACASKVSGITLAIALVLTLCLRATRDHVKTLWPLATLALAAVIFAPVVRFEASTGWPMVHHRFVETQQGAGFSARNMLAIVFGQALYVSPGLFACGLVLGRELVATRRQDLVRSLLAMTTIVPLAILGVLCLWSRVAEPHWLAPVWLALPLYFAHRSGGPHKANQAEDATSSRLLGARGRTFAVVLGLGASVLVYAWVLIPSLVAVIPSKMYDAKLDIANELYGWPIAVADVQKTFEAAQTPLSEPGDVVVVGPVWMICAQLRAALSPDVPVGCAGHDVADFATWNPRQVWSRADVVVFVYDNRAPVDHVALFPDRVLLEAHKRTITRGGRVSRVFTIEVLGRRAAG